MPNLSISDISRCFPERLLLDEKYGRLKSNSNPIGL